MRKQRFIPVLAALALTASLISCKEAARPQMEKSYKTLTVEKSNASISTLYSASIRGEQFVDIRPQVSGVITKIAINEGAKVTKGQTLFVIDQVPYQAALEVAKANVMSAKSAYSTAKLNAESAQALYKQEVISQNELLTLENALSTAVASLAQAEAEQRNAINNLSYTVVKSPVEGAVGMINYRTGALVSSSITSPLLSVSNNNKMYAYFSISESALLSLIEQSGSTEALLEGMDDVTLILNNGSTYSEKGEVDAISGVIDQSTGSVSLRASFANPNELLRDGGNGALSITTKYEDVIVIPKIATYEIQDKTFAFKVENEKAVSVEITVQQGDNGKEFIVTSGLKVGDVIIAEGAGLMREGTTVKTK